MTEHTQQVSGTVARRDWSAPRLRRLTSSYDIEASSGIGEDGEGLDAES